jgi:hypothetical protein
MFPIALLEMIFDWLLKSKMPRIGVVLTVDEVAVITIVEEPSRLPMVLPVTLPTLNRPSFVPSAIALNPDEIVPVPLRAVV